MTAYSKSLLLFALNFTDAQLTIIWVRNGWATEANGLMAYLLDAGNAPFLLTKVLIGASVAYVFYRWSYLRLARGGMSLALGLYLALMFVHAATGLHALGWGAPETLIAYAASLPENLLAFLF